MSSRTEIQAMLRPRGLPREKTAAAIRALILLTVFAMAWLQPSGRQTSAFELVILVGALYVLATSFIPWSRYDARRTTIVLLAMDVLLITALIFTQEGVRSEYYLLYYLPILHASVRLSLRDAAGTCVLAALSYFLVGILERPDSTVTTSVISRVLTFTTSAGLLAGFFVMLSRERRAFDKLTRHYEEATKAKSEFLSRVSHEFRTPLTAIVGFSQLLYEHEKELDPSRQHEYLTVIREQSQQLARMIEDMLDVTRMDDGRLRLNQTACKMTDIIESSLMLLDSQAERQRVLISAPAAAPIAWVDRGEVEQALSRIIYCALDAGGDEGTVSVTVSSPEGNRQDVMVVVRAPALSVTDEDMAVVFGPSAAVLTQKPSSGKALGLAVARALIEMHGGRVWITDDPDGGSAINLTVPRYRVKEGGPSVIVSDAAVEVSGIAQA
ncbi:MAG: histidine kinase dimerization/phospho-acceptor domain-containing protein [Armatimonadota bacterium]